MSESPLLQPHKESGATLASASPDHSSSLEEEYAAATADVVVVDRCHVGRLKVSGRDGLDLLNRLSTNNLEELTEAGQGMRTVLTTNKGRVIDLLTVVRLDDYLLVLTGSENQRKVAESIDFYTFSEDVSVDDATDDTVMIGVAGPRAAALLAEVAGQELSAQPRYSAAAVRVGDAEALVIRTDFAGLPGYELVVEAAEAPRLWTVLEDAGARPIGVEALDVVRVEQGVPLFGRELTEKVNPLEANLLDSVSFNKGCYVGQEVVARLNTYEKVQRRLVGLSWDGVGCPAVGTALSSDGTKVGEVTSAGYSPRLKKSVGLGYVRKAQAEPGVMLVMGSGEDGGLSARVEALPF